MVRTTIMADKVLLEQLRAIAKDENVSLGEVIRQGMEWRVTTKRRPPTFLGAVASSGGPSDAARRDEKLILEWVRERDARRRDARL